MKQRALSTARGVALVRALEMQRPPAKRLSEDPYAASFVNPLTVAAMRLYGATGLARLIGVEPMMNFAIARERYIHDLIVEEAQSGLEQLVILGAGFDTRAYRTPSLAALPVFEIDHPVTQVQKREALRGVVTPPPNVRFVGVDFDVDDLGARLAEAGYREAARTLFVWQGVTMYLTQAGIDHTLSFVARRSAPGSAIVFDYFDAAELARGGAWTIRFFTATMGERVRFALDAAGIDAFLRPRGFTEIRNIDGAGLAARYGTKRPIAPGAIIASARVAGG